MQVEVRNKNLNRALLTLKRKLREDGLFQELKERQHYEKPSERRRRVHRTAVARQRKEHAEKQAFLFG